MTAFEEFWQTYPRKVGKRTAEKAFHRACVRAGPKVVLDGARRLAADPNLPSRQFIPHPTTWLNRDGWEDEDLPPIKEQVDARRAKARAEINAELLAEMRSEPENPMTLAEYLAEHPEARRK